MYRYEYSNIGMGVCIHDKGCTCHSVALSYSVCEGWPEQMLLQEFYVNRVCVRHAVLKLKNQPPQLNCTTTCKVLYICRIK